MNSPFPGMDPFLEKQWQDVHARLILYACDQLEEQLPANLIARVEKRLVLEAAEMEARSIYPDVKIVERPRSGSRGSHASTSAAVMEPVIVQFRSEPSTETFVNILDPTNDYRLVTVIEVLSPANKLPGEGQRLYRQKQQELSAAHVSLVEIDLLRKGERVLSLSVERMPRRLQSTYQVCVRRGWKPDSYEIYPLPIRNPLPSIRVPLREDDPDIHLDLQALLNQVYRKGRYEGTIDYHAALEPPLSREDGKWARSLLRKVKTKDK
jgi:hypothetical protein